jgi:hypothetical protein
VFYLTELSVSPTVRYPVKVWQWKVRSADLLGGSLGLNWSNTEAFWQKGRSRKTSRVRIFGPRAEMWLRKLPPTKQGRQILNRDAQSKLISQQISERRNCVCYMQVNCMLFAFELSAWCYENPVYLYVFIFYQINLNGRCSDVTAMLSASYFCIHLLVHSYESRSLLLQSISKGERLWRYNQPIHRKYRWI